MTYHNSLEEYLSLVKELDESPNFKLESFNDVARSYIFTANPNFGITIYYHDHLKRKMGALLSMVFEPTNVRVTVTTEWWFNNKDCPDEVKAIASFYINYFN
jgi:hypothetical protein